MNYEIIEWQPKYELGIEDIDYQHHFFLNLINRLARELQKTENIDYRAALISELSAYGRFHFISEENIMFQAGYPEFIEHKNLHFELIDQLSTKANLLALTNSNMSAMKILDFLIDWFLDHTATEDRLFANYLHGNDQNKR